MFVESVNRAEPVSLEFNGKKVTTGIFKTPVTGNVALTELGVEGDSVVDKKVHGGLDQAVYLYHREDYDWWAEALGSPLAVGTFGENLTISGSGDIAWTIGDRLKINDVVLEITAPRTPCFKLGVRMQDPGFVQKFAKANRPGAYARIIKTGSLSAGDAIEVTKTTEDYAPVKEVFAQWHTKDKSAEVLKRALGSPIARVHKKKIQNWYDQLTAGSTNPK